MKNIRNNFLIILGIALLGEIYFYPFYYLRFRFSAGVIALGVLLLSVDNLNALKLSYQVSSIVFILRTIIERVTNPNIFLIDAIGVAFPGAAFYAIYCILFYLFDIRKFKDSTVGITVSLFGIDVISNIFETIISNSFNPELFRYIIYIGLIRSITIALINIFILKSHNKIKQKEYLLRYVQLNNFVSNIQAEMFYLKKSSKDIEDVMSESYDLYNRNKENPNIKEAALEIARKIHEIKKDYYRVINGFDSFVNNFEKNKPMKFKDIFFIIESNANRIVERSLKSVEIEFIAKDNVSINKYYPIFTVLNNLIANAIDSIKDTGKITVTEEVDSNLVVLTVKDNGEGIENELIPYIYNPGFTTKFDDNTGSQSTGIGLSHISNIITELNGEIKVNSNKNGTEFKILIPIENLG